MAGSEHREERFDVIVVGGGASGMMAAGVAAARGLRTVLIERNRNLGEKLKITGGGRCNVTNAEYDIHRLLKSYGTAAPFLYSPFSQFGVAETFAFFEQRGLPLVVQARNRAFPHTENAPDVVRVMKKHCTDVNVVIKSGERVVKILREGSRVTGVETKEGRYLGRAVILSTGGVSHPETGSTGDGFGWLKDLRHTVAAPTPTIVPLEVQDQWVKALSGTSLSFMKINFFLDGAKRFSKTGKVLFTHFGLSGPLILNLASEVADLLRAGTVTATIDAYPHTDHGPLDDRVVKSFDASKNRAFKNAIKDILPDGMLPAVPFLFPDIDPEKRVHSISKEERKKIVSTLKALPITIEGLMGFDRAVVADGGVPLTELDTKTMRSKKYDNLYIIGDLLHINRPSGGYSLQLCWTTGFVAGNSVAESLMHKG